MPGRFRILLRYPLGSAAVLAFLVVLLLMGWRRVTEPRVMGKGIREWVSDLPYDNFSGSAANEAIAKLGMEAVPYLLEAMEEPSTVEMWLARRVPRVVDAVGIDLQQKMTVSGTAAGKLAEMARGERLENELRSEPMYPLREAIWPSVLRILDQPEGFERVWWLLHEMGPMKPEAVAAARRWWARYKTGDLTGVKQAAMLLATHGDPAVLPDFLAAVGRTNLFYVRIIAIDAIGELGHRNEAVEEAVRAALKDPVPDVCFAALRACALLGMGLPEEASMFESDLSPSANAFQPGWVPWTMLRWLSETNSEIAAEAVAMELRAETSLSKLLRTMRLLGRAGAKAERFVPELVELREDPRQPVRIAAMEALRRINPEVAEKERRR